jgi:hypothetical protein
MASSTAPTIEPAEAVTGIRHSPRDTGGLSLIYHARDVSDVVAAGSQVSEKM